MPQKVKSETAEQTRLSPTVLLLSDDEALAKLVLGIVKRPWKLVRHAADKYVGREVFAQPNVRLVILDDQAVEENDRGWLLEQIRKHFSGPPLLYVAGGQSDANEKRARSKGALRLRFEATVGRTIRTGAAIIFAGEASARTIRSFNGGEIREQRGRIERREPNAHRH